MCLLHANELPLRHLFQKIDGKTAGPQQYSGAIGRAMETCETMPTVEFEPIPTTLPLIDKTDLSSDQQYLLDICRAISAGTIPTGKLQFAKGCKVIVKVFIFVLPITICDVTIYSNSN